MPPAMFTRESVTVMLDVHIHDGPPGHKSARYYMFCGRLSGVEHYFFLANTKLGTLPLTPTGMEKHADLIVRRSGRVLIKSRDEALSRFILQTFEDAMDVEDVHAT